MPSINLRRLMVISVLAVVVSTTVLATLVTVGWLAVRDALLLEGFVVITGGLGIVALGTWRVLRRLAAGFEETHKVTSSLLDSVLGKANGLDRVGERVETALGDLRGTVGEDRLALFLRLDDLVSRIQRLQDQLADLQRDVDDVGTAVASHIRVDTDSHVSSHAPIAQKSAVDQTK